MKKKNASLSNVQHNDDSDDVELTCETKSRPLPNTKFLWVEVRERVLGCDCMLVETIEEGYITTQENTSVQNSTLEYPSWAYNFRI